MVRVNEEGKPSRETRSSTNWGGTTPKSRVTKWEGQWTSMKAI